MSGTDWAAARAPSLDEIEALARDAFAELPEDVTVVAPGDTIQVLPFAAVF